MSLIVVESGASSFPPLMHYGARRGRGRGDYSSLVPRRYFIIGGCILTTRLVQAESVCKRSSHWTHQRGSFCETRSAVLDHAGAMKAISSCGVRWRSAKWRPPMRKETSRCHRQFKDSVFGDWRAHCCQVDSWPSVYGYRPDGGPCIVYDVLLFCGPMEAHRILRTAFLRLLVVFFWMIGC